MFMIKDIRIIRSLWPLLKLYPWGIPSIVVLGILSSFFEGFGISLFIPLLQSLNGSDFSFNGNNVLINGINQFLALFPSDNRLLVVAFFIFASIFLKNAISYSNSILFSWLKSRITHRLRSEIFDQLLHIGYEFLEHKESGTLMNTLATETWQTGQALTVLVNLIIGICTISVFVILLILISWQMTLLVSVLMVLISLAIQLLTRRVKQLGEQAVEANAKLSNRMWESFGGMRVIRAFGRELYEKERFDRTSEKVSNTFLKLDMLSGLVNPVAEILSTILLLCIFLAALYQDRAALPTLLTFIFILYRLQPRVKHLNQARVSLVSLSTSVDEVLYLLNKRDKPYIQSGAIAHHHLKHEIRFDGVGFYYSHSEKPALQSVSITIPQGKTTALVGPSGAGKSTLINLICRFYDPTSGTVYADGQPLPSLDLPSWRNQIAVVSQDIYVFATTVRDNIAYGRLDATDTEIVEAAKLANAHDFIMELPQGYDTKVGDRGIRLSGGQRQRLALARAIIRNPDILILDEATNALDSISENLIQEALNALSQDRTIIVIAHRLSTVEQADQIIVLKEGQVIEQGTFSHLLTLDGLFAKLYHLQHSNFPAEVVS
jgi:ATP-binding cassette, subfamily B, bacterial MsbA